MTFLRSITILGFRGFSSKTTIQLAVPNGAPGSGLTMLVGPNNSGKSTVLEALNVASERLGRKPSFSMGKRNRQAGDSVSIKLTNTQNESKTVESIRPGGSQALITGENMKPDGKDILVLSSRRNFAPKFGRNQSSRESYSASLRTNATRRQTTNQLPGRLFEINDNQEKRTAFDALMARLISPPPSWVIDEDDDDSWFLKYAHTTNDAHGSEGLGEGLISLLYIVDALYDSEPSSVIGIDEPELSLHPAVQRALRDVLVEYSADRQIIVATHSPIFIDWPAISNGGNVVRIIKRGTGSKAFQLSKQTKGLIRNFLSDTHNPHVLGLDASEVFFLEDGVIILEGQEDVIYYPRALRQLGMSLKAPFFGWGAGGAMKIRVICRILKDLGFRRVASVVDGDRPDAYDLLKKSFPSYHFELLPADDIRHKQARKSTPAKSGLLNKKGVLNPSLTSAFRRLVENINGYISD